MNKQQRTTALLLIGTFLLLLLATFFLPDEIPSTSTPTEKQDGTQANILSSCSPPSLT